MRIREARLEHCGGLARVQVDSYRTAYAGLLPEVCLAHFSYQEQEFDWRELLSSCARQALYVAEVGGEVAGYALGRPQEDADAEYASELVALHVRSADQRQGAGHALVAAVAGHLNRLGCASLMSWVLAGNTRARRFYERLGGQPAGQKRWTIEELAFDAVLVGYGWPEIERLCRCRGHRAAARPRAWRLDL